MGVALHNLAPDYMADMHPGAKAWIHRLYSLDGLAMPEAATARHGSALTHALAQPAKPGELGMMDTARDANLFLECWERAGWIIRDAEPSPTTSQHFAGVGGGKPGKRKPASSSYAVEFGYSANTTSESLLEYIRRP